MVSAGIIVFAFTALAVLIKICRPWIYDVLIVRLTEGMYREVLQRLDPGSTLLDVGIGTGTALLANKTMMCDKNIYVVGVDYEQCYINKGKKNVRNENLNDKIGSVYSKFL